MGRLINLKKNILTFISNTFLPEVIMVKSNIYSTK